MGLYHSSGDAHRPLDTLGTNGRLPVYPAARRAARRSLPYIALLRLSEALVYAVSRSGA